ARARNAFLSATSPPGLGRRAPPRPTVERIVPYSPVAFNDIKHLARSMPADGLEAQDVVPLRSGCWVAHIAIFSSRQLVFGQSTHARTRGAISERTKAALAAAKRRGVKLGGPRLAAARKVSIKARSEAADAFAANVRPIIKEIQASGVSSMRGLARALAARGVKTARGGDWSDVQVAAVLRR